jgi:hypothetical protein
MATQVIKLDIVSAEDIAQDIVNVCENQYQAGFKLRGLFESSGELVMVFQKD